MQALPHLRPETQSKSQTLFRQAGEPLAGAVQTLLQVPQFWASVVVFTHAVPHLVGAEAVQSVTQVGRPLELEHKGVAAIQDVVQAPQWLGVLTTVSQSGLLLSQLPKPLKQIGVVHCPPEQDDVALVKVQALPQRPQFDDVSSGVSHPGWLLQSPKPPLQPPI